MRRLLRIVTVSCWALSLPAFAQTDQAPSSSPASQAATADAKRSDRALARDVRRALGSTRGIDAQGVRVTAGHGAITLSGTVRTLDEMNTAERVARSVRGVQSVSNKLTLFRGEGG